MSSIFSVSSSPRMPCSGAKIADELYVLRFVQNVDRLFPCEIAAGVICDQADLLAFELFESVAFENVDAVQHRLDRRASRCQRRSWSRRMPAFQSRASRRFDCSRNLGICAATGALIRALGQPINSRSAYPRSPTRRPSRPSHAAASHRLCRPGERGSTERRQTSAKPGRSKRSSP